MSNLKIGIVGLPNVGKSTLFNAITNSEVEAANYPFATIEPNIGVVEVKDKRVDFIFDAIKAQKKIYNQITFFDIAGLVKGASKGEGLGNKFLSNIRECDAIVHMVRLFENADIVHVENNVDPLRDIEIINIELILSDIEQLEKWMSKNEKRIISNPNEKDQFFLNTITKALNVLKSEIKLEENEFTDSEKEILNPFNLLTLKPTLYVGNVLEDKIKNFEYETAKKFLNYVNSKKKEFVIISAQIEYEISKLTNVEDQKLFLEEIGLQESGLNEISRKCFSLLNLSTYFTAGVKEVHAWAFKNGINAAQGAGIIHSDFERGFIKAEIYSFEDFKIYKSEAALKEKGLLSLEGKDYKLKDGDVCHFRFNV